MPSMLASHRRHTCRQVAVREGANLTYLYQDHLGSAAVAVDASTNRAQYLQGATTGCADALNYGARWYDPITGRFLQADTIVPEPGNPQSLNRYSYCLNNPLKYTDPTGHAHEIGGKNEYHMPISRIVDNSLNSFDVGFEARLMHETLKAMKPDDIMAWISSQSSDSQQSGVEQMLYLISYHMITSTSDMPGESVPDVVIKPLEDADPRSLDDRHGDTYGQYDPVADVIEIDWSNLYLDNSNEAHGWEGEGGLLFSISHESGHVIQHWMSDDVSEYLAGFQALAEGQKYGDSRVDYIEDDANTRAGEYISKWYN